MPTGRELEKGQLIKGPRLMDTNERKEAHLLSPKKRQLTQACQYLLLSVEKNQIIIRQRRLQAHHNFSS
jgi:hypothetical protein